MFEDCFELSSLKECPHRAHLYFLAHLAVIAA